jgi:hypothetical protein
VDGEAAGRYAAHTPPILNNFTACLERRGSHGDAEIALTLWM